MPFETEYPPSDALIMLTVLRCAADGDTDMQSVLDRVLSDLKRSDPDAPALKDEGALNELRRRLQWTRDHLTAAGVIETVGDDQMHLTDRGASVLEQCPDGVDDSVLMQFPEFRAYVAGLQRQRMIAARRALGGDPGDETQEGYIAFLEGRRASDNPYEPDTHMHEAWDEGYWEGAADARIRPRP